LRKTEQTLLGLARPGGHPFCDIGIPRGGSGRTSGVIEKKKKSVITNLSPKQQKKIWVGKIKRELLRKKKSVFLGDRS